MVDQQQEPENSSNFSHLIDAESVEEALIAGMEAGIAELQQQVSELRQQVAMLLPTVEEDWEMKGFDDLEVIAEAATRDYGCSGRVVRFLVRLLRSETRG